MMADATSQPGDGLAMLYGTDGRGRVLPMARNVYMALRHHPAWRGVLRHNELIDGEEYHATADSDPLDRGQNGIVAISDDEIFHARCWLESAINWSRAPGKELVADAIEAVARKSAYHPVRDYLAPLPRSWDGTERISMWLADFCGADDSPYTRAIARKTLIAAAARAFRPGCKHDTMLVLVGAQGARKSTLIRELGRGWTIDTPIDVGSKDGYETIRGAWLVEMPELAGLTGRDVERLKAFFSSPIDVYRPPYARKPVRRPRSCVFIGSTNDSDFLRDATGSRRFWCVRVADIDVEALGAVLDQLWAEATLRMMEGETHWLDIDEAADAETAAAEYLAIDPWEDTIRREIEGANLTRVHASDVYSWLEVPSKDRHAGTAQRIVRIMCGRLGWRRPECAFWYGGRKGRGFVLGALTSAEADRDGTQETTGSEP
jgi:putative DNA primase/helicase